jgi:hypothetical protein
MESLLEFALNTHSNKRVQSLYSVMSTKGLALDAEKNVKWESLGCRFYCTADESRFEAYFIRNTVYVLMQEHCCLNIKLKCNKKITKWVLFVKTWPVFKTLPRAKSSVNQNETFRKAFQGDIFRKACCVQITKISKNLFRNEYFFLLADEYCYTMAADKIMGTQTMCSWMWGGGGERLKMTLRLHM